MRFREEVGDGSALGLGLPAQPIFVQVKIVSRCTARQGRQHGYGIDPLAFAILEQFVANVVGPAAFGECRVDGFCGGHSQILASGPAANQTG